MFLDFLTNLEQFVLDIKNTYNPIKEGDNGGIVVYGDSDNYLELEEYYDPVQGTTKSYPWLRLVRDYNRYFTYYSDDGKTWGFLASGYLNVENPKIGIYLKGNSEEGEILKIEEVKVFKGTKVMVDNLEPGTIIELLDPSNNIMQKKRCGKDKTAVIFNTNDISYPLKGKFKVTLPDGNIFKSHDDIDINGGDCYSFEINLKLYYVESYSDDNSYEVELYPNIERFLGYLKSQDEGKFIKMIARNSFDSGNFKDVLIELIQYETNHYLDVVRIAPDVNGSPGIFGSNVRAFEINSNSDYIFWICIKDKDDDLQGKYNSQIKFGIRISSNYI